MDPEWPKRAVVQDPIAVDLLTNLNAIRYYAPFMRDPHTLTSAATILGKKASTVAYWIPKFANAGLLDELEPIDRAGVAMRRYRSVARELLVPIDCMPLDRRVALLDEGRFKLLRRFLDGLDDVLAGSDVSGMLFQSHGEDPTGMAITAEDSSKVRRWHDGWLWMRLADAEAESFAKELEELVEKYDGKSRGRTYLVHVGLAPEARHPWRSAE